MYKPICISYIPLLHILMTVIFSSPSCFLIQIWLVLEIESQLLLKYFFSSYFSDSTSSTTDILDVSVYVSIPSFPLTDLGADICFNFSGHRHQIMCRSPLVIPESGIQSCEMGLIPQIEDFSILKTCCKIVG